MEVCIMLGVKESVSNYILGVEDSISNYIRALPVTSLGCTGSVVAKTHMPDTAGFLRLNQVRLKKHKAARRESW